MATILPRDLPAAVSVTPGAAIISDSGSSVEKATPIQLVDAAIPLASQGEAEAGADNAKRMTPLRVKQAIDAQTTSLAVLESTSPTEGTALLGYSLDETGAADQNAREKFTRQVETRDFGDKTRSRSNFILSKPYRVEGYELDARETGIAWDWDDTAQTGTDDSGALQEGLDWLASKGGGTLRLPFNGGSDGGAIGSELIVPSGVSLIGADSSGSNMGTTLVGIGTSGAILRVKDRAAAIRHLAITSSDARWAVPTNGTMHGIFLGDDDAPGMSLMTKTCLSDIYVLRQPGDAFHGIGSFEHSHFADLWAVSCKRHGFAFDDGTRSGYTNKPGAVLFTVGFDRLRALDCGGNAGLFGNASATVRPFHVKLDHFEALGCGWDTSNREFEEQLYLRGDDFLLIQPDLEDQQFANSTLSNTGDSKNSRTEPSGGMRFLGQGLTWIGGGHISSVKNTLVVGTGSSGLNIDVSSISAFQGAWASPQPVMFTIPVSVAGRFVGKRVPISTVWTKFGDFRSAALEILIDGDRYLGTPSSIIDTGIFAGTAPQSGTIVSGGLLKAAQKIIVTGGGVMNSFQYVSGFTPPAGHFIYLLWDGTNNATITNAGNITTKSGSDVVLSAARQSITLLSNGTELMEQ